MTETKSVHSTMFLTIVVAILAFLLFDISILFFPSLPNEVVVFWDLTAAPILVAKAFGMLLYPIVLLGTILAFFVLPKTPLFQRLQSIVMVLLLLLYSLLLLHNFSLIFIDSKLVLLFLFSSLSIILGIQELRYAEIIATKEQPQDENTTHQKQSSRSSERGELLAIASQQNLSLQKIEGWGLLVLGLLFFVLGLQADMIRAMSMAVFLYCLLYVGIYLYSYAVEQHEDNRIALSMLDSYKNPSIVLSPPITMYNVEKKVVIKRRTKEQEAEKKKADSRTKQGQNTNKSTKNKTTTTRTIKVTV